MYSIDAPPLPPRGPCGGTRPGPRLVPYSPWTGGAGLPEAKLGASSARPYTFARPAAVRRRKRRRRCLLCRCLHCKRSRVDRAVHAAHGPRRPVFLSTLHRGTGNCCLSPGDVSFNVHTLGAACLPPSSDPDGLLLSLSLSASTVLSELAKCPCTLLLFILLLLLPLLAPPGRCPCASTRK